jgi:hypothetical protein
VHAVQVVEVQLAQGREEHDSRGVDDHVETPVALVGRLEHLLHVVFVGDVGAHRGCGPAGLRDGIDASPHRDVSTRAVCDAAGIGAPMHSPHFAAVPDAANEALQLLKNVLRRCALQRLRAPREPRRPRRRGTTATSE